MIHCPTRSQSAPAVRPGHLSLPYHYTLLIVVSSLDLIFTYIVLMNGGFEANPIARLVLESGLQFNGLIVYKFVLMFMVIAICEFIGRHAPPTSHRLASWAVGISSVPVAFAVLQLLHAG